MIQVAAFADAEEAERAGKKLVAEGISPTLGGPVGRAGGVSLSVPESDFDRACEILNLQHAAPPAEPRHFHPCPSCGADDPSWFGKRKLFLLIGIVVALYLLRSSAVFGYATVAAFLGFFVAIWFIPEFECRNCRKRWSRAT